MDKNRSEGPRVHNLDIAFFPNAFAKSRFLESKARRADGAVIYVDFDLLYGGYTMSGLVHQPSHILVRQPGAAEWNKELCMILQLISKSGHLVILDSLNGFNALWPDMGSGRQVACSIMLLAAVGRATDTRILVGAVGRRGDGGWDLHPGGRLMRGPDAGNVFQTVL